MVAGPWPELVFLARKLSPRSMGCPGSRAGLAEPRQTTWLNGASLESASHSSGGYAWLFERESPGLGEQPSVLGLLYGNHLLFVAH